MSYYSHNFNTETFYEGRKSDDFSSELSIVVQNANAGNIGGVRGGGAEWRG